MKKLKVLFMALVASFVVGTGQVMAALDPAVQTELDEAKVTLLAAVAILTGIAVAVWGGTRIYSLFRGKGS